MRTERRVSARSWLPCLLGILSILVAACGGGGGGAQPAGGSSVEALYAELAKLPEGQRTDRLVEGAKKEGKLVVMHAASRTRSEPQVEAFKKKYPFLNVEWQFTTSAELVEKFLAEEASGQHLTDVISHCVATDCMTPRGKGLLAKYETPLIKKVDPAYKDFMDPDNYGVFQAWSDHGTTYNTNLMKPADLPKFFYNQKQPGTDDLCDPKFRGKFSFEYVPALELPAIYAELGDDTFKYIECMGKNGALARKGYPNRFQEMLAGDYPMVAVNFLNYCLVEKAKNANTPCAHNLQTTVYGVGEWGVINKNAKNPHAAALWVDFTLSEDAQKQWATFLRGTATTPHPYLDVSKVKLVGVNPMKFSTYPMEKMLKAWEDNVIKQQPTK